MTTHPVFGSANISGIIFRNRLLRSATHESLADSSGAPTAAHESFILHSQKEGPVLSLPVMPGCSRMDEPTCRVCL